MRVASEGSAENCLAGWAHLCLGLGQQDRDQRRSIH